MELMFRVSASVICVLLVSLLIRRTNPEMAALLGLAVVAVILLASLRLSSGIQELHGFVRDKFGLSDTVMQPVIKCVAAAIVTRLTADLCKDSSQSAAAAAVELAGSLCALGIIMPLLMTMLRMVGGLL